MLVEIIQGGKILRTYNHEGQMYVEAPPEGAYAIRLMNLSRTRQLAVVSVDGVNVIDGTDAGFDGPGYVLRPNEKIDVPGWRRDGETVAKFTFQPQDGSYANRTGRSTKNTGVIGVAVFAEAQPAMTLSHFFASASGDPTNSSLPFSSTTLGMDTVSASIPSTTSTTSTTMGTLTSTPTMDTLASTVPTSATGSAGSNGSPLRGLRKTVTRPRGQETDPAPTVIRRRAESEPIELGTGYGKEAKMHTETTTFNRASEQPSRVFILRYGVRAKLIEWGVPVADEARQGPQPFPASASVPPPPGWRAAR